MTDPRDRRSFLSALVAMPAALAAGKIGADGPPTAGAAATGPWDLSWLDQLRGKHKQVFAIGSLVDHYPLHVVSNYFDAHEEVFGLRHPDVNAVVGIIARSFPINAGHALWVKYELGRRYQLRDPQTGEWAVRNVYLDEMPAAPGKRGVGVRPLQRRGAIFWMCNNSLGFVARTLARETKQDAEAVRTELLAGLNLGVKLVPAHTMVLGLAQERGCTYEQVG
jgi:hypothetical protein